jgi:hypothetical protein
MRIAMTYPPWLTQAYAKAVDPGRGSRRQALAETGNVIRLGAGARLDP